MNEPLQSRQENHSELIYLKVLIGFVLIAVGVLIALWTINQIIHLLTGTAEPAVVTNLVRSELEDRTLTVQGQAVTIPALPFKYMGYSFVSFLYFICAILAKSFIAGGVRLLQGDLKVLERNLLNRFSRLEQRIDNLNRNP